MTVAVTLFALLELYKRGEADWVQDESFGEIAIRRAAPRAPSALEPDGSLITAGRPAVAGRLAG
jgi:segregation and condensation protein A